MADTFAAFLIVTPLLFYVWQAGRLFPKRALQRCTIQRRFPTL